MKSILIILLLVVSHASNAQKLLKPKKDKETGVTVTRTESIRMTPTKKGIFIGWEAYPVYATVAKTDTNSIYLALNGQSDGRLKIQKGDSVKLSMSDGSILWLRAHYDQKEVA